LKSTRLIYDLHIQIPLNSSGFLTALKQKQISDLKLFK
jgi:hypothetical protein